jgi:putative hydrolase of the HAD superfamily
VLADMWAQYLGTANQELIAYARSLRPRFRTAILSASFVGAREREAAAYGFPDLVDDIVYTHEVGLRKPSPEIFALAASRLGVEAAEIVLLDDIPPVVEAARAAGWHAVLFETNAQAIAAIETTVRRPT